MTWCEVLAKCAIETGVQARLKWSIEDAPSEWGWMGCPVPDHLEPQSLGPLPASEIEWVELKLYKLVYRGRLLPEQRIDVAEQVLAQLAGFGAEVRSDGEVVRIVPSVSLGKSR